MAMSNTRDGGAVVVIGVRENLTAPTHRKGCLRSISTRSSRTTSRRKPPATPIRRSRCAPSRAYIDRMLFVVIEVDAFSNVPTVCKQADGGGSRTLREGAVYIRPAGTPRTEEIHTHRDMRDIIEQAVERRIERFRALGLLPPPRGSAARSRPGSPGPRDRGTPVTSTVAPPDPQATPRCDSRYRALAGANPSRVGRPAVQAAFGLRRRGSRERRAAPRQLPVCPDQERASSIGRHPSRMVGRGWSIGIAIASCGG